MRKWLFAHNVLIASFIKHMCYVIVTAIIVYVYSIDSSLKELISALAAMIVVLPIAWLDSWSNKQDSLKKFYWDTHVKLLQIQFGLLNDKNYTYEFKWEYGNFIGLCGKCPRDDQELIVLCKYFQNSMRVDVPQIVQTSTIIYNDKKYLQVSLNFPKTNNAHWTNLKFAYENLSEHIAKQIRTTKHEFKLYPSAEEYFISHPLVQETWNNAVSTMNEDYKKNHLGNP